MSGSGFSAETIVKGTRALNEGGERESGRRQLKAEDAHEAFKLERAGLEVEPRNCIRPFSQTNTRRFF